MFWIFALGIVALAVYNPGFRKVTYWAVPLGVIIWFLTLAP